MTEIKLSQDTKLAGKIALVTGAARGLGLNFAEAFVARGAKVALLARSGDKLRSEVARLGPNALAVEADISDPDSVRAAFAALVGSFGGLDILVNNATLNYGHRIEDATDAELQAEVGVNLLGQIYCVREAVPLMRARGAGDIVNISSESVIRPFPFLVTYAAYKAACETLMIGLRSEVRKDNIRATTLRSGSIATGGSFLHRLTPERVTEFVEAATAAGLMHEAGKPMTPDAAVNALIGLLEAPRDAHIDMISVRAV